MDLIVLDTETTGISKPIGVCECAFIQLDPVSLVEIGRHESLIDPELPISASASGIHRITNDMVADKPTLAEWFGIVLGNPFTQPPKQVVMVAHNAAFDYPLVEEHLGESVSLCTLKLSRLLYPQAENHKLATLKFTFGLGSGGYSHAAASDVEDTADLLRKIVADTGMTIDELLEYQNRPRIIEIMPFSREHKGKPLKDVPKSFWVWLQRQKGGVDADLAYSVNLIHPDLFKRD